MRRFLSYDIAADLDTPVSAYLKLRPVRPHFLLESVEQRVRVARYSFIGLGDCQETLIEALWDGWDVAGFLRGLMP